jgi:hypothetical protein
MKKLLIVAVAILFTTGAYAQGGAGIKAGVNFANQDITDINTESRTGYHFGAFFELRATDNIIVQPEVLFSTHGSKITISNTTEKVNLSYLNIPLLLKFRFLGIADVHLGPQFGVLSNAEYNDQDIDDQLKAIDFSLIAGAGINLPMGLIGGARYVYGLSDYNESFDPGSGAVLPEVRNKTVQIYLGLKLF